MTDGIIDNFDDLVNDYTGEPEWHAVYTIQLGELVQSGVFDWSRPELEWKEAAYDEAQYERVCAYFIKRFYFREVSLLPLFEWFNLLQNKLVYELMPKYRPLYKRLEDGFNPLGIEDEYYKRRTIDSAYPETLLSGNADYISEGTDEEWERIKEGETVERFNAYVLEFQSIDQALLNELDDMFCCMYTANVNGW